MAALVGAMVEKGPGHGPDFFTVDVSFYMCYVLQCGVSVFEMWVLGERKSWFAPVLFVPYWKAFPREREDRRQKQPRKRTTKHDRHERQTRNEENGIEKRPPWTANKHSEGAERMRYARNVVSLLLC